MDTQAIQNLPIDRLEPHPSNSNVMAKKLFAKLVAHLRRTDRYPPVIVRAIHRDSEPAYQILDGHHRVKALKQVGQTQARCVVWAVDDDEALVLLATLNHLRGDEDLLKRADLIAQLHQRVDLKQLACQLPRIPKG